MSDAFVLAFDREVLTQEAALCRALASAWTNHGPRHRGVGVSWSPRLEPTVRGIRGIFEISDADAALLSSRCFCIPPERADAFFSKTAWAWAHTRPFLAEILAAMRSLRLRGSLGVWSALLRGSKRCPPLVVTRDPADVRDFLEIRTNELLLDVRAHDDG